MKPAMSNLHGSAERSAFSWHLGELLAPVTINSMTFERASLVPLVSHLTKEELTRKEKQGQEGADYLLNVLKWFEKVNNCVAFYIPKNFRTVYQKRFESMTQEPFWYKEVKTRGTRYALVPLPSFMGQTALDDKKLSSKNVHGGYHE